ncbi:MAG: MG2 domain-containing protein [Chromatiales bacterium]|nr:MG2 domain-containing protein [Chromatiales bacterium]
MTGIPLKRPGFYVAELASPRLGAALLGKHQPFHVQSAALVTNLAAHLKLGRENSLVWVTTLDKAQPVRGAEVAVRDCGGAVHFRGRTDAAGILRIDQALPARDKLPGCLDKYDRQYFVTARLRRRPELRLLRLGRGHRRRGDSACRRLPGEGPYVAHAVLDRTLLRAGETVHMKHVPAPPDGQRLRPAVRRQDLPATSVVVRHAGTGTGISELAVTWEARRGRGRAGRFPADAKQGAYEIFAASDSPGRTGRAERAASDNAAAGAGSLPRRAVPRADR